MQDDQTKSTGLERSANNGMNEVSATPDSIDEFLLVTQAQTGDEAAFTCLVEPHVRKIFHAALRITRNREDAEDATQQTLLNAYVHIGQFRGQARFSSWLLRIAMNEAMIRVRKRRSEAQRLWYEADPAQGPSPLETLRANDACLPDVLYSRAEKQEILWKAIGSLGSTLRVVVWILGLQERKTKEAAKALDLTHSAVKTRFSRARRQLRQCLAERI